MYFTKSLEGSKDNSPYSGRLKFIVTSFTLAASRLLYNVIQFQCGRLTECHQHWPNILAIVYSKLSMKRTLPIAEVCLIGDNSGQ